MEEQVEGKGKRGRAAGTGIVEANLVAKTGIVEGWLHAFGTGVVVVFVAVTAVVAVIAVAGAIKFAEHELGREVVWVNEEFA